MTIAPLIDSAVPSLGQAGLFAHFETLFGAGAPRCFVAPGRVNLIGEHTDYNDGFVLPIAINRGTCVLGRARPDRLIRVHSLEKGETRTFDLDRPHQPGGLPWLNYVEGEARSLEAHGWTIGGADLLIESNVPVGAGLSSSAALENAVGYALLQLAGIEDNDIDRKKLALAGQAAEHQYVGTQCGIMDQFVTAMGQTNHALLIDCRMMTGTPIPINLPGMVMAICDSGVRHELATSGYNQRRAECQAGVRYLQTHLPGIQSLRDVTWADWDQYGPALPDAVVQKRVRHVLTENARTLAAAEALKSGNTDEVGHLMRASHQSMQHDYEITCPEIDTLVDIATRIPGVAGARMTGGGFGGCTINLVHKDALDVFRQEIAHQYNAAYGRFPNFLITTAYSGVAEQR